MSIHNNIGRLSKARLVRPTNSRDLSHLSGLGEDSGVVYLQEEPVCDGFGCLLTVGSLDLLTVEMSLLYTA